MATQRDPRGDQGRPVWRPRETRDVIKGDLYGDPERSAWRPRETCLATQWRSMLRPTENRMATQGRTAWRRFSEKEARERERERVDSCGSTQRVARLRTDRGRKPFVEASVKCLPGYYKPWVSESVIVIIGKVKVKN